MESVPCKEDGSSPKLTPARMFSLRIVHLDYYMAAPLPGMDECYSHFQGRGVLEVPVVRIFGSTTCGQKTCLHLHKAFPYFYVSYDDGLPQEVNEALAYVRRLASAVEKACKIASTLGAKRQHVHSCSLVRGRKYYGYYPNEQLFIKIVLYYPQEISRMSTLLLSGGIMNHKFQPYESHIPYLLQILIDYNLYGMGHLHVSSVKFRNPLPQGSSNLQSLVAQVKSEFVYRRTDTAEEPPILDSLGLNVAPSSEMTAEKNHVDPPPSDSSVPQKKDESPITIPVVQLVPPSSNQSTPENQQGLWLRGNVPGGWIWPIHSSSQGREGPYSRQSICELEADTTVTDILNRRDLLFRPLQQTGPEVKMVQSLTPIWEEELLRTGEGGPAGPVNAQYQPTARTVAPASALEQAMRNALFQIANMEEHQAKPTQCSDPSITRERPREEFEQIPDHGPMVPSRPPSSDLYSIPSTVKNKTLGEQDSVPSFQDPAARLPAQAQGSLLQCTQLANGEVALASPELEAHPKLRGDFPLASQGPNGVPGSRQLSDAENSPKQVDDNDETAVNEDAIMSHLSQRLQSQDLDNEAAELLRWLGATQDDEEETSKEKSAELSLSQMFSSPGMDSALLKALADYESATEQECQAILDCVSADKDEAEGQDHDDADVLRQGPGDKEGKAGLNASTSSSRETHGSHTLKRKQEQKGNVAYIPQTDGPCDDEDSEDKVDLDDNSRESIHRVSGQDSQEVSLREMMRRRRDRRPRKKERSSSPSFSEDAMESAEQGNLKDRSAGVSRLRELHGIGRKTAELDDQIVQEESRRKSGLVATTSGRTADKYSEREKKGKSDLATDKRFEPKSVNKYTALPLITVKSESSKSDTQMQFQQDTDADSCGAESNENLRNAEEPGNSNSLPRSTESSQGHLVNKHSACNKNSGNEDRFVAVSSGDDRDCGGGDGPRTSARQEAGEGRDYGHSSREWNDGAWTVTRCQALQTRSAQMNKIESVTQMQSVDTGQKSLESSQEKELITTQNRVDYQNTRGDNEEPSSTSLADIFAEIGKFVGIDRNGMEYTNVVVAPETEHTSELEIGRPDKEESSDYKSSPQSRLPATMYNMGQAGGLDSGAVHSTQYLFTDMSDDSHDSFDSGGGKWAREHNWDSAESYFGDEGQDDIHNVHAREQRQLAGRSIENSTMVPPEACTGKAPLSQKQIAVRTTAHEPFVLGRSFGKNENAEPASSYKSSGNSIMATSNSLSHGNTSQKIEHNEAPQPPAPISQSGVILKASQEGTKALSSLRLAREEDHSRAPMAELVVRGATNDSGGGECTPTDAALTCDEKIGRLTPRKTSPEVSGQVSKQSPAVPFAVDDEEGQLYPLIFHRRPPDREQILANYREKMDPNPRGEGGVYYGNVKDVSDRPTVMAGLIFDVKSRDAVHLRPFEFGGFSKRSKFEQGSKSRQYIEEEYWGAEDEMDTVAGLPSHFENDGRASYLITPAKPPPSPFAVREWVSSMKSVPGAAEKVGGTHFGGEQMFTMDANTGKLVPIVEIGSAKTSQESLPEADASMEYADYERPASPKYNETHVFNLTHQSSALPTRKYSQWKPGAVKQGVSLSTEPSVAAAAESAFRNGQMERPVAPSTVQTAQLHLSPPEDSTTKQPPRKGVMAGDNLPQERQNKQLPGNKVPQSGRQWRDVSQMTAISPPGRPTPLSQSGFRDPASVGGGQQTTLMSIEVFAETRGSLLPDPRYDAIGCIVIVICEDGGKAGDGELTIVLIRDKDAHTSGRCVDGLTCCETVYLPDEVGLLNCFARLVRHCDPDMLLGWEVQGYSLGLLAERAANLGISFLKQLSRMPPVCTTSTEVSEKDAVVEDVSDLFDKLPLETKGGDEPIIEDEWGRTHGSGLYVGGRIVLNLWRILRGEVKLGIYTLESVAEAVLRRRVPRVPWITLTRWFSLGPGRGRFRCLEYFIDRARLNLQIMDQLDLMNRTAELARVFGIDFYSVFSRGSQFRVESMMARLAHTQNYILVAPTRQQVADQPGMECLPLVMEPESRFYTSPVIVLDFQSLYPSMIIAYNLCFSTCLGKLVPDNPKVLGVGKLSVQPGLLDSLKECMTITPNGVMFVPSEVRPGVLPRLLQEILSTRIMVKKAMKQLSPDQKVLQRVLNARQFALKLIANVTYGYTAAGFSGRMPCAEIADSIVQCGRLTLERAIHLVNSHSRWGGRVVYGDTDSMFVLLEGRTREEAHAIGQEIAAAVTEMNPPPVALKMEKVYHPCVLLTKKRYVGYSYESAAQLKPTFDAKGIETVRRDTCKAVAKTLEHSLRTLFESQDLSQVKQYLQRQWGKILSGRISHQDFIFAKEVRLGTYSSRSPVLPPAAIVASKAMAVDPRAEPRYAERIPYVVVHGEPGARLVDMVVDPLTLIDQPSLRLHDTYYITKQIIPACQRVFMLVGVDLKAWFSEMPRVYRPPVSKRVASLAVGTRSTKWDPEAGTKKARPGSGLKHGTIDQYYLSRHCTVCGEFTRGSQLLCSNCTSDPGTAAILLTGRTSRLEREHTHLLALCRHCGGGDGNPGGRIACISLDCSVFFERRKVHRELQAAGAVALDLGHYPPCLPELF